MRGARSRVFLGGKLYLLASGGMAIFTYQGARDMINVLLPAIQTDFGLNYTALGLLAASYDWGHAAVLLLFGYLSDRYGRVRAILVGLAWFVFATAATGLSPSSWSLIALRFTAGFAFATYFVAGNALVADAFPPSGRGRAVGLHYAGGSAGRLVLPLLAGAIAASAGWRVAFLPVSMAGVLALLMFFLVRGPSEPARDHEESPWGVVFGKVLRDKQLRKVTAIYALVVLTNTELVFVPVYLVRTWGLAIFEAAIYLGIAALVAVPSAALLGELSDRLGWKRVLVAALAVDGLLLGAFPFAAPGAALVAVMVGFGIVNRSLSVAVFLATRASEPAQRGMSLGLVNTVGLISLTLVSVLGGYIADLAGLLATFLFMSLVAVAFCASLATTRLGRLELRW